MKRKLVSLFLAIILAVSVLPAASSPVKAAAAKAPFGNTYQDLAPLYNVAPDKVFTIKLKLDTKKPFSTYRIERYFSVFTDRECTNELLADIKYDEKTNILTIRPDKDSWGMYPREGVDTASKRTWGGLQKYYLVIAHDIKAATVTPLKTPKRMLFTVGSAIEIPSVKAKPNSDGNVTLSWNPVAGASTYKVYYGSRFGLKELGKATDTQFVLTEDKYKESSMNTLLSDVYKYAVTAVVNGKESRLSNIISGEDLEDIAPARINSNQETMYGLDDIDSILELPRTVPVQMKTYLGSGKYLEKDYPVAWDFENYKDIYGFYKYSGKVVGTTFTITATLEKQPTPEEIASFKSGESGLPNVGATDITDMIDIGTAPTTPPPSTTTPADITGSVTTTPTKSDGSTLEKAIADGLLARNTSISLSKYPESGDADVLKDTLAKVLTQYPLILDEQNFKFDFAKKILIVTYSSASKDTIVKEQKEITDKVKSVIASIIKPGMTVEDKEKAIHDWITANGKYNDEVLDAYEKGEDLNKISERYANSFNPYGILIEGLGVCQSYAEVFKLLCDAAGVPCVVMTGKLSSVPHAWNMVKIDQMWFHVDVTNNDGDDAIPYAVYNASDALMAADYSFDKDFELDKNIKNYASTKNTYDYYYKQGLFATSESDLSRMILAGLTSEKNFFIKVTPSIKESTIYDSLKSQYKSLATDKSFKYGRMFNVLGVFYDN